MIRDACLEEALGGHVFKGLTPAELGERRRHRQRISDWPEIPQLSLVLCLLPLLRLFQESPKGDATVGALGLTAAAIWLGGWLRGRIASRDIGYVAYFPLADERYARTQLHGMLSRALAVMAIVTLIALPFGASDLLITGSVAVVECALMLFTALALYHIVPRLSSEKTGFVLIVLACMLVPMLWINPAPWLLVLLPAGWPLVLVPQMTDFAPPIAALAGMACVVAMLSIPWLYQRAIRRFYIYELHLHTAADPAPGVAASWTETADAPTTLADIAERVRAGRRRQQQILEPTLAAQLRAAVREESTSHGLIERLIEQALSPRQRAAMTYVTGGQTGYTRRWLVAALVGLLGMATCVLFPNSFRGECWTAGDTVMEQAGLCVALLILGSGYFTAVWMPGWTGLSTPSNSQGMPMFSVYPVDFRTMAGLIFRVVLVRSFLWLPLGLVQVAALSTHFDDNPQSAVIVGMAAWLWQLALLPAFVGCMVGNAGTRQTALDGLAALISFLVWLLWLVMGLCILGPVLAVIPTALISWMIWATSRQHNDTRADFVQRFRRE